MGNNFLALCYAAAKKAGKDTSKMSPDEVIEWYNKEHGGGSGDTNKEDIKSQLKNSIEKVVSKDTESSNSAEKSAKELTNEPKPAKITFTKTDEKVFKEAAMQKQVKYKEGEMPASDYVFTANHFVLFKNGENYGDFKMKKKLQIEGNEDKIKDLAEEIDNAK